jgi:hypothetical protein
LYLVREGRQFVLLSEGLMTEDELLQRMVFAAHAAGWITEDEFNSTLPRRPSLLSDEQLAASVDANDPGQIVDWLRSHDGVGLEKFYWEESADAHGKEVARE